MRAAVTSSRPRVMTAALIVLTSTQLRTLRHDIIVQSADDIGSGLG
jgi:hypothetical protein